MDTIFINDLVVHITIGNNDWERVIKQPIILNLCITTNFSTAVAQDDISFTIDYSWVVNSIIDFCNSSNFKLLESLVFGIEKVILSKYTNILSLEVSAKKAFALLNTKEVGVKIARSYAIS